MKDGELVYAERLRMVLNGIGQSLPVGFFLATLLVVVYALTSGQILLAISADSGYTVAVRSAQVNGTAMTAWYVAFMLGRIVLVFFARQTLARGYQPAAMPRIVRWLLISKVYEGIVWGILVWIVLQANTSPGATALLLALMAAISSNAVSLLSPITPLYLGLMLPMLLLSACRFFTMDGLIYEAMGVCCLLYVVGQYGQARLIGHGLSDSIKLRFENLELIARLKTEKTAVGQAREAAEEANLAKSRFLAAASHDLRQPVHALGLFLEALSCSPLDARQRQVLDNAKAASLASADMLNTLLDFSRIEAGVVRPKPRPCALQPLLNKIETELAPQADAKGLIYRCRDTDMVGFFDPTLLELILRNLISNAIRYTEKGGLLVACRRHGEHLTIDVYDTGIGIAPHQQREVFREFHQLGNPERDRRKGLGLGLAIADGLARSMGQTLTLTSQPGRGSRFRLTLPLAQQDAPPLPVPDIDDNIGSVNLMDKHILVVDDDESVRLGMQHILTSWGVQVQTVESLEQAMLVEWTARPDLILCDYRLREKQTGGEVIAQLRQHFDCHIPALLVTGDTAPERLREASASGIPLLHKPVSADQLRAALLELMEHAERP